MRLQRLEPADLVAWAPHRRPQWGIFQAAHLLLGWKPPLLSEFKDPARYFASLEPRAVAGEIEALYTFLQLHSERGGRLRCRRLRIGQRHDVRPLRRVHPVDAARLTRTLGIPLHPRVHRLLEPESAEAPAGRGEDWIRFVVRVHDELAAERGASPIYSHVLRYAQTHPQNTFIRDIDWAGGFLYREDSGEAISLKSAYHLLRLALRARERR